MGQLRRNYLRTTVYVSVYSTAITLIHFCERWLTKSEQSDQDITVCVNVFQKRRGVALVRRVTSKESATFTSVFSNASTTNSVASMAMRIDMLAFTAFEVT